MGYVAQLVDEVSIHALVKVCQLPGGGGVVHTVGRYIYPSA